MKVTHLKVKLKFYANCYHKCYVTVFTKGNIIFYLYLENVNCPHHTQALHTYRINEDLRFDIKISKYEEVRD